MSDSKPYEIRLALLQLAKDVLSENAHMKIQVSASKEPLNAAPNFTTDQILKEAEKLYGFVNKR